MLDEKSLKALYHIQGYQRRLRKAFDKKLRTKDLKLGCLVLKEIQAMVQDVNGKFKQNWAGPKPNHKNKPKLPKLPKIQPFYYTKSKSLNPKPNHKNSKPQKPTL